MSTGAIIFLIAILIFFVFEVGSLIATLIKKRKAQKAKAVGEVNENKSNEEVNAADDRCTDNAVDNRDIG